jgi:hypothetical protein
VCTIQDQQNDCPTFSDTLLSDHTFLVTAAWEWSEDFLDLDGYFPAELYNLPGLNSQHNADDLSSLGSGSSSFHPYESMSDISSISVPTHEYSNGFLDAEASERTSIVQLSPSIAHGQTHSHMEAKVLPVEQMVNTDSSPETSNHPNCDNNEHPSYLLPPAPRPFKCELCHARFVERRQLQ